MAKKVTRPVKKQPVRKVSEKEGLLTVTATVVRDGKVESTRERTEKIQIRPFVTDTANVSVKLGVTMNMGDYSSARADVMLSVPCYVEEMVSVYRQIREIASGLVSEEIDRLTGEEAE